MPPDAPLTPTTPEPGAMTPVKPVVVASRSPSSRWVNLLLGAAAVLAVGGVAFALGRATAPADAFAAFPDGGLSTNGPVGSFDPGAGPQVRPGPGFLGVGPTLEGSVTAVDADSMTIQLTGGEELTVALDDDTTYHEATATDADAVRVGDEVAVQADGGMITLGGDGTPTDPGDGGLSASDVTVRR